MLHAVSANKDLRVISLYACYSSNMNPVWMATAHVLAAAVWFPAAPPAIQPGGVVNAASLIPPALPGGSLAPGSLVRIYGDRLGPTQPVEAPPDSPVHELGGVGVIFRAAGVSAQALLRYVSAARIDAILPGRISPGEAALEVTFNGQRSEPYPVRVVEAAFGIFSPAYSPEHPARPGEVVTLTGTGLGLSRNVEVFVGGQPARRILRAAPIACCPGTDELRFAIPERAPAVCSVPVQVRVGGRSVSNSVFLPIALRESLCEESGWALSEVLRQPRYGWALLWRLALHLDTPGHSMAGFEADVGAAAFRRHADERESEQPLRSLPTPGTCVAYARTASWSSLLALLSPESRVSAGTGLDAGPRLRVTGPQGSRELIPGRRDRFTFSGTLGGLLPGPGRHPMPMFFGSGTVTVQGAGGADVGPFTSRVQTDEAIVWTDRDRVVDVFRSRGLQVHWKAPKSARVIVGAINTDQTSGATGLCVCLAKPGATSFTIPALALANLPASGAADTLPMHWIFVAALPRHAFSTPVPGLDGFAAAFASVSARTVHFR